METEITTAESAGRNSVVGRANGNGLQDSKFEHVCGMKFFLLHIRIACPRTQKPSCKIGTVVLFWG